MRFVTQPHPKPSIGLLDEFLGPQNFADAHRQLQEKNYPCQELMALLQDYNRLIENDSEADAQIRRLGEQNTYCVITGQQLGLMSGPSYTILKGISCLIKAKELNAIPIFWLATEDHDVAEVDHTTLLDKKGNLKRVQLNLPRNGRAVEDLQLGDAELRVIRQFCEDTGCDFVSETSSYSKWMARLMARMFRGTGMVFVEPYVIRSMAAPIFERELQEADQIYSILQNTTQRLLERGGEAPIRMSKGPNLFYKNAAGIREKVNTAEQVSGVSKDRWSGNVCLRPVIQNGLFPTLAYVAGPAEMAYHQQLKEYHTFHGVEMPWLVPRLSATLLTPQAQEILDQLSIRPWDPLPEKSQLPSSALHNLRNSLHPQNKLPERVFNWWTYQQTVSDQLIYQFLETFQEGIPEGHHYCYL